MGTSFATGKVPSTDQFNKIAESVIDFAEGTTPNRHLNLGGTISGIGVNIASANTISIPSENYMFLVTGTTNITTINASRVGRKIALRFNNILTISHSASLSLPQDEDIETYDDLILTFIEETSGNWRMIGTNNESWSVTRIQSLLSNDNFPASATGIRGFVPLTGGNVDTVDQTANSAAANMPVPGTENFPFKVGAILVDIRAQDTGTNASVVYATANDIATRVAVQIRADGNTGLIQGGATITIPVHNYDVSGQARIRLWRQADDDITNIFFVGFWVK